MSEVMELKPCPFCGEKAEIVNGSGIRFTEWLILCTGDCPVSPSVRKETPEEAVVAWNTRANPNERAAREAGKQEARAQIAKALNVPKQTAAICATYARTDLRLRDASRHEAQVEAYDNAIKIVNQE